MATTREKNESRIKKRNARIETRFLYNLIRYQSRQPLTL